MESVANTEQISKMEVNFQEKSKSQERAFIKKQQELLVIQAQLREITNGFELRSAQPQAVRSAVVIKQDEETLSLEGDDKFDGIALNGRKS